MVSSMVNESYNNLNQAKSILLGKTDPYFNRSLIFLCVMYLLKGNIFSFLSLLRIFVLVPDDC